MYSDIDFSKISKIHFIGIGGASMRALAEIMEMKKNIVSGTDKIIPVISNNIKCFLESEISQVPQNTDYIVFNNVVPKNHPEILYAIENNIPLIPRAYFLNEITKDRFKFLVTGTDGKTSTSFYMYQIAERLSIDPLVLIGTEVQDQKCYKFGSGPYIVEHNEGDLTNCVDDADIMIFTTFDGKDHIWNFDYSYDLFYSLYKQMFSKAKKIICNINSPEICKLLEGFPNMITFGTLDNSQFKISNIIEAIDTLTFNLTYEDRTYNITTHLHGEFSAYNVTAAIIGIFQIYPDLDGIIQQTQFLKHAESRFEIVGQDENKIIFNSMHGSGISLKKVVDSLKKYGKEISIMVNFNNTRGEIFFDEFYEVLKDHRFACLKDSYIAKNIDSNIASIIESQEDFNKFLDETKGICLIAHAKYCFHKYLKNYCKDFKTCFG